MGITRRKAIRKFGVFLAAMFVVPKKILRGHDVPEIDRKDYSMIIDGNVLIKGNVDSVDDYTEKSVKSVKPNNNINISNTNDFIIHTGGDNILRVTSEG